MTRRRQAVVALVAVLACAGAAANPPAGGRAGQTEDGGAAASAERALAVPASAVRRVAGFRMVAATLPASDGPRRGSPPAPPVPSPSAGSPAPQAPASQAAACPRAKAGAVVRAAPGRGRTVALTFDDGPGADTPAVLDILRAQRVPASFFVVGVNAVERPELVARIVTEGHLLGDHTWSHPLASPRSGWSAALLTGQAGRTNALLRRLGGRPVCWFRPPGGVLPGAAAVARRQAMAVALWSVDPADWQVQAGRRGDPRGVLARIITARATASAGQRHPVVLLHDGGGFRGATVRALPKIIAYYRERGYRFVRLDGRA